MQIPSHRKQCLMHNLLLIIQILLFSRLMSAYFEAYSNLLFFFYVLSSSRFATIILQKQKKNQVTFLSSNGYTGSESVVPRSEISNMKGKRKILCWIFSHIFFLFFGSCNNHLNCCFLHIKERNKNHKKVQNKYNQKKMINLIVNSFRFAK